MEREFSFVLQKKACEVFGDSISLQDEFLSVQGMVDCLFGEGDSWTIVDYKTDWISNEEAFIERYRPQLVLYREAVEKVLGNR